MYISDTKEDKILLSKAEDVIELSQLRHKPCYLGFLNEREAYIINNSFSYAADNITYYGGYEGAMRTVMCSFPYEKPEYSDFPIESVYFSFRESDKLSHRDFLGALLSLGIDRSCVGDIIVNNGCAVVFIKTEIADFVKGQIFKIGRVGVKILDCAPVEFSIINSFEELNLIVSSMRLDVIVAAITRLSREKTASLILSGKVICNYVQTQNVSSKLDAGDILSIRGYGKYVINEQFGLTKNSRIKLLIKHFR